MKKLILLTLVISIIGLSACTANEEPIEDNIDDPTEDQIEDRETNSPNNTWPSSKEGTIEIEGKEESITLKYYEGENFITYVPEDMIGELYNTEEGDAYRFYTNYQGNKNNEIYMQILFYPDGLGEKPDILGDGVDLIEDSDREHDWAIEEYASKNGDNYAILGQHGNQYFSITLNIKEDYAEGFLPRANKIIDNIYFTDTKEYLVEQVK